MTLTSDPTVAPEPRSDPKPTAAELARQRRERRTEKMSALHGSSPAFLRTGINPRQVPFVAVLVGLLGAGLAGVLWLNTLTDQAGIKTNAAKIAAAAAQIRIEGLESDIAAKNATPSIAAAALALGLVPAGDSAILVVPTDGGEPTVIGTPVPVPDPVAEAAAAQAAAAQAAAEAAAKAEADRVAAEAAAKAEADRVAGEAAAAAAAAAAAVPPAAQTTVPAAQTTADAAAIDPNAGQPGGTAPTTEAVPTTLGAAG